MNRLIYVETSIPSFYFETRSNDELQIRRRWTREWWKLAAWQDALITSPVVIDELQDTPEGDKKQLMFERLDPLPRLDYVDEIDSIVAV